MMTAEATDIRVVTPFPDFAAPRIWAWMEQFRARVADDFSPQTEREFMAAWEQRANHEQRWAVYRGDELGGLVTLAPVTPCVLTSHVVFKKQFWGQDCTLEGIAQVYEVAFELPRITKISSLVFADNAQIIGLAKRLGAEIEGRLRNHTMRGGQPVDMIALGLLKEDFHSCRGKQQ